METNPALAWGGGQRTSGSGERFASGGRESVRVVAHIDMDAFYAQIEQVRDPGLTGKPVAVVQYPTTMHNIKDTAPEEDRVVEGSASSIIAVSYEARAFGVKRNMKGGEAKKACRDLFLVQVPTRNAKADLTLYRQNGEKVVAVLERAGGGMTAVEKASIDEVYVDITHAAHTLLESLGGGTALSDGARQDHLMKVPPGRGDPEQSEDTGRWEDIGVRGGWPAVVSEAMGTHVAGVDDNQSNASEAVMWWARPEEAWENEERLLACGAAVVSRLRAAVRRELKYSCSAGIAHNKLLAKLCSSMHKPNAQTVLPVAQVPVLFATLPLEKVRGWGGKLGVRLKDKLGVTTAGEVAALGPTELQRALGEVEGWRAWEKSRGIDKEAVKARSAPKSIGCSKTFPGKRKLKNMKEVERWLSELSKELCDRLGELARAGGRPPRTLTLSFYELQSRNGPHKSVSRCCRMVKAEVPAVVEACLKMFRSYTEEPPALSMLGVSTHGFEEGPKDTRRIDSFFSSGGKSEVSGSDAEIRSVPDEVFGDEASPKVRKQAVGFPGPWVGGTNAAEIRASKSSAQKMGPPAVVDVDSVSRAERLASPDDVAVTASVEEEPDFPSFNTAGAGSGDAALQDWFYGGGRDLERRGQADGAMVDGNETQVLFGSEAQANTGREIDARDSGVAKPFCPAGSSSALRKGNADRARQVSGAPEPVPNRAQGAAVVGPDASPQTRVLGIRSGSEIELDAPEMGVGDKETLRGHGTPGLDKEERRVENGKLWGEETACAVDDGLERRDFDPGDRDSSSRTMPVASEQPVKRCPRDQIAELMDPGVDATHEGESPSVREILSPGRLGAGPEAQPQRERSDSCASGNTEKDILLDGGGDGGWDDGAGDGNYAPVDGIDVDLTGLPAASTRNSPGRGREGGTSDAGGAHSREADEGRREPSLLFGRVGASARFGDIDLDVLAELPAEIQRQVWMQQEERISVRRKLPRIKQRCHTRKKGPRRSFGEVSMIREEIWGYNMSEPQQPGGGGGGELSQPFHAPRWLLDAQIFCSLFLVGFWVAEVRSSVRYQGLYRRDITPLPTEYHCSC